MGEGVLELERAHGGSVVPEPFAGAGGTSSEVPRPLRDGHGASRDLGCGARALGALQAVLRRPSGSNLDGALPGSKDSTSPRGTGDRLGAEVEFEVSLGEKVRGADARAPRFGAKTAPTCAEDLKVDDGRVDVGAIDVKFGDGESLGGDVRGDRGRALLLGAIAGSDPSRRPRAEGRGRARYAPCSRQTALSCSFVRDASGTGLLRRCGDRERRPHESVRCLSRSSPGPGRGPARWHLDIRRQRLQGPMHPNFPPPIDGARRLAALRSRSRWPSAWRRSSRCPAPP